MSARQLYLAFIFSLVLSLQLQAQSDDSISNHALLSYSKSVANKVEKSGQQISSISKKALNKLEKQERQLYKKLYKIDSVAAKNIFSQSVNHYNQEQQKIIEKVQQVNEKFSGEYIAYLDTLTNSIAFLKEGKELLNKSEDVKEKLSSVSEKVKGFNNTVQQTEQLKQYISERKEYLKSQLSRYTSLSKDLTRFNKTVFYYNQQIREIKGALKDPKKAEEKILALLQKNNLFQEFMKKNSFLAGIFNIPLDYGSSGVGTLQTRNQVSTFIQARMTSMGPNAQQQIQQNIQSAQQQLSSVRNKFPFLNSSGDMPDFKPNMERTKQFKKRLEFGSNIQTTRARTYFPTTTDFAFSLGYKLNPKSVIGVGSSLKMGWGSGIDHIKITQEGLSVRSFIDWKLKGSFWISGGYEQNYLTAFRRISELQQRTVWKQSGLLGISKVIDVKSNFFKKSKVQILYDFLWRSQSPVTNPVLFRVGYNF